MYSHACSLGYGSSSTLKVGCCSHQHLWSIPNAFCLFRINAPRTICITWPTTCVDLLSSHHYPPVACISFFFYDSTSMQHRVMVQSAGTAFIVQSDIPANSYWIALSHLTQMLPYLVPHWILFKCSLDDLGRETPSTVPQGSDFLSQLVVPGASHIETSIFFYVFPVGLSIDLMGKVKLKKDENKT